LASYASNYNFWKDEKIWRGRDEILPEEEYVEGVSNPASIKLGKLLGVSPARMEHSIGQIFARGNPMSDFVGMGMKEMFPQMAPTAQKEMVNKILSIPGARRVLGFTNPMNPRAKMIKEANIKASTEKYKERREFYRIAELADEAGDFTEMDAYIRQQAPQKKVELLKKLRTWKRLQEVPNKRWWLQLKTMKTPEAKAHIYFEEWKTLSSEEQKLYDRARAKVGEIISPRFTKRLNELKKAQPSGFIPLAVD